MSAKNWTTCPQCSQLASQEQEKARGLAAAAYGNVSREEYAELQKAAERESVLRDTLREDWSIGVGTDGKFRMTYHCHCEECGFKYELKVEDYAKMRKAGQ
jgi:hypothetical protein